MIAATVVLHNSAQPKSAQVPMESGAGTRHAVRQHNKGQGRADQCLDDGHAPGMRKGGGYAPAGQFSFAPRTAQRLQGGFEYGCGVRNLGIRRQEISNRATRPDGLQQAA